jgi:hypothetical protein
METKVCSSCGTEKALGAFRKNASRKDGYAHQCKSCSGEYDKKRYKQKRSEIIAKNLIYYRTHKEQNTYNRNKRYYENKEKIKEYLMGHPCTDCNESDIRVLVFHHVLPKSYGVTSMVRFKWDKILTEIAKCVVVCANCHMIRHYKE